MVACLLSDRTSFSLGSQNSYNHELHPWKVVSLHIELLAILKRIRIELDFIEFSNVHNNDRSCNPSRSKVVFKQ